MTAKIYLLVNYDTDEMLGIFKDEISALAALKSLVSKYIEEHKNSINCPKLEVQEAFTYNSAAEFFIREGYVK
jgi:hypothetical protein